MKKLLLTTSLIVLTCVVFGQDEKPEKTSMRKNTVYLELGGNALYYSVNYDRIFSITKIAHVSLRTGFFMSPEFGSGHNYYVVPLEVNALLGKENNFFELGFGQSLLIENSSYSNEFDAYTTLRLGYRHMSESGLMVRAGIVPILKEYDSLIWIGLGVGYAF